MLSLNVVLAMESSKWQLKIWIQAKQQGARRNENKTGKSGEGGGGRREVEDVSGQYHV